jgi:hypothetical protein
MKGTNPSRMQITGPSDKGGNAPPDELGWNAAKLEPPIFTDLVISSFIQ